MLYIRSSGFTSLWVRQTRKPLFSNIYKAPVWVALTLCGILLTRGDHICQWPVSIHHIMLPNIVLKLDLAL